MSGAVRSTWATIDVGEGEYRLPVIASGAVLTLSYLVVLYHVVDVTGGPSGLPVFFGEVLLVLALAVWLSRWLSLRWAVVLGGTLLAGGLLGYLLVVSGAAISIDNQVRDTVALLTGLSVLRMLQAGTWVLGFTPGPLFVSWYLLLRRRYVGGAAVGGAALSLFVLTGDADVLVALLGVLGAVGVVGFGELDRSGGSTAQRNTIIAVLVAMLVITTSVSLVPGGQARPLLDEGGGGATVEESLLTGSDEVDILGPIELSPSARFTVSADRSALWRVGAYDRYTGAGWVRTGERRAYADRLTPPPDNDRRQLEQTYVAESSVSTMPAAWKPVAVLEGGDNAFVTDLEGLQAASPYEAGDRYRVLSLTPESSPDRLRAAGTDYPDEITDRYLQLPESTPERVASFTREVTEGADTPYDAAVAVETWLEDNRAYSLTVERPSGDIASAFLFEMTAGYCTYYATAMVAMLRSQDIPSRFVVGYNSGQRVGADQWVVRGFDSHAWVEVYFPRVGWVAFDPTPAGPRRAAELDRLSAAREGEESGVDTDQSVGLTPTPVADAGTTETPTPSEGDANGTSSTSIDRPGELDEVGAPSNVGGGPTLPSRRTVLYGLVLLIGGLTALQRVGLVERFRRERWLRRRPGGPPETAVVEAYDRLEYVLSRRYRPRRPGETRRAYLADLRGRGLDGRALELYALYEPARYAGRASHEAATTAWELVEGVVADRTERLWIRARTALSSFASLWPAWTIGAVAAIGFLIGVTNGSVAAIVPGAIAAVALWYGVSRFPAVEADRWASEERRLEREAPSAPRYVCRMCGARFDHPGGADTCPRCYQPGIERIHPDDE